MVEGCQGKEDGTLNSNCILFTERVVTDGKTQVHDFRSSMPKLESQHAMLHMPLSKTRLHTRRF